MELEQCRHRAPDRFHFAKPVSPQLDPVRVFARFASQASIDLPSTMESIEVLPESVQKQRAPLWRILEQSLSVSDQSRLKGDLVCKHQQWCVDKETIS